MKLYVARHGQTQYNAEGRYAGSTDVPLSGEGIRQAEQLAGALAGRGIEVIVSSSMLRARQTAAVISGRAGIPIECMEQFVERNVGAYEGLTREQAQERYPGDWARLGSAPQSPDDGPPGGETIRQCDARVWAGLKLLRAKHSGKVVLLVCHGFVARTINRRLMGLSFEQMHGFTLENCGVAEYELGDD